jgi:hypothetical protein
MTVQDKARALIAHPAALGWALGYKDFKPNLHGEWIRWIVTGQKDGTLQAHRGSYKTTCLCVGIALLMMKERGKNIIFLRKTDNDVAEVVQNVDRILQSPVMQEIFLALTGTQLEIIKSTNTEITTSAYNAPRGSAQLLGIGIGGSLTGKHADIIITDDIVNLKDRQSRAERDRTKAVYMELQNIKNRGGRIINTGTPWHKEDCFTLMPEPMKFDCYHTGLLSKEQIETLRQSMAPSLFAANYELQHIASENALFTIPPTFTDDESIFRDGMAHIDAAYGGEDWTAFTCGKRVGDKLYMYGRAWQKHVDTVLPACIAEAQRLMCAPVYCEDNGDKGYLAKEIKRLGARPAIYHEKENKYIKISSYLRKWWPNIVWLEGTDREYINQIMDYTEDAEHDDCPDSAASMARIYDRRSGTDYHSVLFK